MQGRALSSQPQPDVDCEQFMPLDDAFLKFAHVGPYSKSTKLAHELMASASAFFLFARPALDP